MFKIKVAVLFGGCSEEHNVSIKSAMEIATNIDTKISALLYWNHKIRHLEDV